MRINKELIRRGALKVTHFASEHAPTALMVLGAAGFVATVVMACKETPDAKEEIDTAMEEDPDISKTDLLIIGAKHYWKPAVMGAASMACFLGANHVNLKKQAALSAAYALSERTLKEYKEGVIAELGESKAEKVEEAIAQKHIHEQEFPDEIPGQGTLFILDWTHQIFRADLQQIRKVVNDLNDEMYSCKGAGRIDGEVKLNSLLNRWSSDCEIKTLGSVALGEAFGFRADLTGPIALNLNYGHTRTGEPCAHIDIRPKLLEAYRDSLYY